MTCFSILLKTSIFPSFLFKDDRKEDNRRRNKRSKYDSDYLGQPRNRHSPSPRRKFYSRKWRSRSYRRDDYNNGSRYQERHRNDDRNHGYFQKDSPRKRSSTSRSYSTDSSSIDDEIGHYFGEVGDFIDQRCT